MTYKNRFITSDLHFGHKNIIEYENRPYVDVSTMNEQLVTNWNKKVSSSDLVYLLGDISIGMRKSDLSDLLFRLNGDIILVMGNHDEDLKFNWLSKIGRFNMVSEYPIIVDDWMIMSHKPIYLGSNTPYVNLYGHVHSDPRYLPISESGACVCLEKWNYHPVNLDYIKSEITKLKYNQEYEQEQSED